MGHHPTQRPFGFMAIGDTEEGNGSGFPAIGRGVQSLVLFGCLATGKREGEVGSGIKDTGSINNSSE